MLLFARLFFLHAREGLFELESSFFNGDGKNFAVKVLQGVPKTREEEGRFHREGFNLSLFFCSHPEQMRKGVKTVVFRNNRLLGFSINFTAAGENFEPNNLPLLLGN